MPQKKKRQPTNEPDVKHKGWFYFNVGLRTINALLLVGISFLIIGGALVAGIGAGYFAYLVEDTQTPTKKEMQKTLGDFSETSKLVYADNSNISTIRSDLSRTAVKSDQISDLLKKAIIATEDEYFNEHNGVVPKSVVRALLSEATGFGGGGGGSTLTQQLVKQQVLTNETTFKRKANEILLAMEVEKYFSKDEIVTMYLNVSPFGRNNKGQNIAGVQEAAKGIFGKDASEVNLAQAAFIAGLPQSPIVYSPYDNSGQLKENLSAGLKRKDYVLFSMYRNHDITKKEYDAAVKYDLTKDFLQRETQGNSNHDFLYYTVLGEAQKIIAENMRQADKVSDKEYKKEKVKNSYLEKAANELVSGGYTVKSTIDKDIYKAMQDAVTEYGYMLDGTDTGTVQVGNIMMDNKTGRVLGFVGGRDFNDNQYNHAFDGARPAGSSIKPILVYGPAIDQGILGTETRISDFEREWVGSDDLDEDDPNNSKGKPIVNSTNSGTNTFLTTREALNVSSNIAAVNVFDKLKSEKGETFAYDEYLKKMNYHATNQWAYEGAALGPNDVSTMEQTNGFQTLANGGVYEEGYIIESITDSENNVVYQHKNKPVQVFSKATASIMNDLMRGILDAGITSNFKYTVSGLNWYLGQGDWVGKTGSSDEYRDSWLIVSTPAITLSSWSGVADNTLKNDSDASKRTGQYMAYLANRIYMANPDVFGVEERFQLDSSVKGYDVATVTGTEAGKVTVNKKQQTIPVATTQSLYAKGKPAEASFNFGIGGTEENYQTYWETIFGKEEKKKETEKSKTGNTSPSSSSDASDSSNTSDSSEGNSRASSDSSNTEEETPSSDVADDDEKTAAAETDKDDPAAEKDKENKSDEKQDKAEEK